MSGSSLALLSPWPSWLPLMPPSCSCYKQCYKYFVVKEFFFNSFLCLQRQMALSGLPSVRVHWGPACLWPWIVTGPVYLQSVTAYFDKTSLPSVCDHGLWHDQSTSSLWPWIVTGPVYLQSVTMDCDRTGLPSVCDHGLWQDRSTFSLWPWTVTGPVYLQSVSMDCDRTGLPSVCDHGLWQDYFPSSGHYLFSSSDLFYTMVFCVKRHLPANHCL